MQKRKERQWSGEQACAALDKRASERHKAVYRDLCVKSRGNEATFNCHCVWVINLGQGISYWFLCCSALKITKHCFVAVLVPKRQETKIAVFPLETKAKSNFFRSGRTISTLIWMCLKVPCFPHVVWRTTSWGEILLFWLQFGEV